MMKGRSRAETTTTTTIFTVNQWNELESQVLTFRYLMSGLPVPPSLMSSVFSSSSSSSDMFPQHQHPPPPPSFGSSYFHVGYGHGRKVDMEPGRCRRTDGKKWRCSKEAHPNSKYCERHMQRSKSKAKKAITNRNPEITTATSSAPLSNAYSPYPPVSYCPVTQSGYPNNKFQPGNSTFYPFLSTQSSSSNVSGSVRNGGTGPNCLGLDDVFLNQPRKEETRYTNSHTRGIVGESFSGFEASKEEHKNETVGEVKEEEEHESQKLYHHFLGDWPSKLNNSRALGLYSTSN